MPAIHPYPDLYVDGTPIDPGNGADIETVTLQLGSEVSLSCRACDSELTETVEGFTSDDDGGLSCPDCPPDDPEGEGSVRAHMPVAVPLSWCNSAGISTDADADEVTVSVSVGDPRGAFAFTVRRVPDDAAGRFAGRLILHVPDPSDGAPHMRLTAIGPGTFLIGDHADPPPHPGDHPA